MRWTQYTTGCQYISVMQAGVCFVPPKFDGPLVVGYVPLVVGDVPLVVGDVRVSSQRQLNQQANSEMSELMQGMHNVSSVEY